MGIEVELFLDGLGVATGLAQLGTVVFILIGSVRRYAFVLTYCSLQLITSLLEVVVVRRFGPHSKQYSTVFWTDEIVVDLLLFLILILLTYRAMDGSLVRGPLRGMLGAATVIVTALPVLVFKGAFVKTAWFNHTSQLLNFAAAILNLGLWIVLLGSGKRDLKLLTVSAGFGIVATGSAISFGLRMLIHTSGIAHNWANYTFVLAHLTGAMILCWAFRPGVAEYVRCQDLGTVSQSPTAL